MAVSIPPDGIHDVISRFLTGMQVPGVSPDATAVARGVPPRPTSRIGAQAPSPLAPAVGGARGMTVDALRGALNAAQHPLATAGAVTGVPSIVNGVRQGDATQALHGSLSLASTLLALGSGGASEALPAAAEAASAAAPEMSHAEMLKNLMESGFAGGKPASAVELPREGAFRGGSTASAMATVRRLYTPQQIRSAIQADIAARGGASSPEVAMAASEEVARKLASRTAEPGLNGVLGAKLSPDDVSAWMAARNDPAYAGTKQHIGDLLYLNRQARGATPDAATGERLDAELRSLQARQATAPHYQPRYGRLGTDRPAPGASLLDFLHQP